MNNRDQTFTERLEKAAHAQQALLDMARPHDPLIDSTETLRREQLHVVFDRLQRGVRRVKLVNLAANDPEFAARQAARAAKARAREEREAELR